jgi:hypothetical protein
MQNEITELRTQVRTLIRTLKRIVCLVCCLFGVFMFVGCSATSKSTDKDNLAQDEAMLTKDQSQVKALYSGFSFWSPTGGGLIPIPGLQQRLKVEKITTISVCRNCIEDTPPVSSINSSSTRGKIAEFILAGGDSGYSLHSESDCPSSE